MLAAFVKFEYPNDIGPGVYDIHSPRVPPESEMIELLQKALTLIDAKQLWINPDWLKNPRLARSYCRFKNYGRRREIIAAPN